MKPACMPGLAAVILVTVAGCGAGASDGAAASQSESQRLETSSATVAPTRTSPTSRAVSSGSAAQVPQNVLDAQLRESSWDNDVEGAADLIERGADVNAKDDTVQSAYLIATSEGYLDLLDLALANGARIDDVDSWNGTGLIRAAERGHSLVVGRLLTAGIDRDHVNRIGYQAIHEAIWLGADTTAYLDTVRALVAGGVELDEPSRVRRAHAFADGAGTRLSGTRGGASRGTRQVRARRPRLCAAACGRAG